MCRRCANACAKSLWHPLKKPGSESREPFRLPIIGQNSPFGSGLLADICAEGVPRVCVATLLAWRVFGDFHDPFAFQRSCSPVRFGFPLPLVFSPPTHPPHPHHVQPPP